MNVFGKYTLGFFFIVLSAGITGNIQAQSFLGTHLKDIDGKRTSLSELKGDKLTVLDFWATWCKPCAKSIPEIQKLSERYASEGVVFIGVNEDSPRNTTKVKPFVRSMGVTYPILLDSEQKLMKAFLVQGLPTLIILNDKGEIVYTHQGYTSGDENIIQNKIDALLAKDK